MITTAYKRSLQDMEDETPGKMISGALVKELPDGRATVQYSSKPAPYLRAELSLSGFRFYLNAWRGMASKLPKRYH